MKLLLIFVTILLLAGCERKGGEVYGDIRDALPTNAKNIQMLGNGWVTFTMDDHKFLFRRTYWDRSATDCVTVVP